MRHPIHDLLARWLGTEQYAFDDTSREVWPPGCWSQGWESDGDSGGNSQASDTATRDTE